MNKDTLVLTDKQLYQENEKNIKPYIFRINPINCSHVSFYVIQEEMEELNDYCVIVLNSVDEVLKQHKSDLSDFKSGRKKIIIEKDDLGDMTDEAIEGLEECEIPKWEHIYNFMTRASCLLLLYIFTEKSLKSLCSDLSRNFDPRIADTSRKAKIEVYLEFLRNGCNLKFQEPRDFQLIKYQVKRIRNDFAHGDWKDIKKASSEINLREAFTNVAYLFNNIEKAATEHKIKKKSK